MDYGIFNVHTYTDTVRESALKVDSGRKIPCAAPGNRTCVSGVTVRCPNQLSYIPQGESKVSWLVSWCLKPSQPQRITSGLSRVRRIRTTPMIHRYKIPNFSMTLIWQRQRQQWRHVFRFPVYHRDRVPPPLPEKRGMRKGFPVKPASHNRGKYTIHHEARAISNPLVCRCGT